MSLQFSEGMDKIESLVTRCVKLSVSEIMGEIISDKEIENLICNVATRIRFRREHGENETIDQMFTEIKNQFEKEGK